jgi:hypothetical protein
VIAAACVGAVLIAAFERYRIPLRDWLLADPDASAQRAQLVMLIFAVLLLAPLLAFAAWLWSLGERVVRAREFPPPGLRLIRDTAVVNGEKAISRGRLLKALAIGFAFAALVLAVLLWRVTWAYASFTS